MKRLACLFGLALLCSVAAVTVAAEPATAVRFVEEAARRGIVFEHVIGDSGEKYMQESMGSGVAIFDADGDGDLDIYLVNGAPLPGWAPNGDHVPTNVLYRNRGDGTFEDVTASSGTGDTGYGMGVAVGDIDNDGDADLYVLNHGPNVLYRNRGDGTFENVTAAAGVGDPLWSSSAVFFDADGDGDLDLFVVNYCDASVENHKWCGQKGRERRGYCTPQVYNAQPDTFYLNQGDGRFVDASQQAGLVDTGGKGLGVVPFDYDNDGDVDLYVANDSTPNQLWRNDGSGHFRDVALLTGVAYSEDGKPEAGMGIDIGDYDGDGYLDLVVTNMDYETNSLMRNTGGRFEHAGYPAGIAAQSLGMVGFGVNWLDADNDSDLDLLVANGHVMDNIEMINDALSYAQPNHLFLNGPHARFREVGRAVGFGELNVARGSAVGDLDGDGRVDVLICRNAGRPGLFMNRSTGGHWLQIRPTGSVSNRSGYGARITIKAGGKRQVSEVHAARSYQSSSDKTVHFGLGGAVKVESLCIRWPSGRTESIAVDGVDRLLNVVEGKGDKVESCGTDG